MRLENLVRTGQLKPHEATRGEVALLLAAAERNLVDARRTSNSTETRFDCAYRTIMQCGLVALHANGFRPDNKRPGHNALTIQSLTSTMGVEGSRIAVLDKLREKRNLADYTGAVLDKAATEACIGQATRLVAELKDWLRKSRPALL
jgi:hypothetical protein